MFDHIIRIYNMTGRSCDGLKIFFRQRLKRNVEEGGRIEPLVSAGRESDQKTKPNP